MPITPLERLEALTDRLDSLIASLTGLTTLKDSVHVEAMRKALPEVATELRDVLKQLKRKTR